MATFSRSGAGSPRVPDRRTRSGPTSVTRTVSKRATTSGPSVGRAGDLVQQLGGHRAHRDQPACPGMLGHDGAAVGGHLGDREAGRPGVGQLVQEGVVAAGGLGPALQDVAGHHRPGQAVPVVGGPAEVPGGRADDQGGVGHPPGDDHVGAGLQRGHDAPGAQVGVGRDRRHPGLGQPRPGVEVGQRLPRRLELVEAAEQVVALDVGHADGQPQPSGQGPQLGGQPGRVEPAGVGHHLDALVDGQAEALLHLGQEAGGVPLGRVAAARAPQDQHGQLGQVVAGEHVDRAALQQLPRGGAPVAVEAGAVGDAQRLHGQRPFHTGGRRSTNARGPSWASSLR